MTPLGLLKELVLLIYFLSLFFLYEINCYIMILLHRRARERRLKHDEEVWKAWKANDHQLPTVTVQLPIYNERYVIQLTRTLPFFQDPAVAMVQVRWGHINRDYSLLTLAQSFGIDGHFWVEQAVRSLWESLRDQRGDVEESEGHVVKLEEDNQRVTAPALPVGGGRYHEAKGVEGREEAGPLGA